MWRRTFLTRSSLVHAKRDGDRCLNMHVHCRVHAE
eukprot:jgi/Antlo1/1601/463